MKIAFVIYNGMTALDFIGVYDPLVRLKTMGFRPDLEWEICGYTEEVRDGAGLQFAPTQIRSDLGSYDLLVIPGGFATRQLQTDPGFIAWLQTAAACPWKVAVCTGTLLLGAAGFLAGRRATTHPAAIDDLQAYCMSVPDQRIVDEGDLVTAGGVTASIDLGLYLVQKLAGPEVMEKIRRQMDYQASPVETPSLLSQPLAASDRPPAVIRPARTAAVARKTHETQIQVDLNLDGQGEYRIETGIGFLDHMLSHLAVHGLFDLRMQAAGDLHIDVHHTVEDVAITLGHAFDQALSDRAGLVRMASAYIPMDEALAFVAVDFSGRPYTCMEAGWHSPAIGGIPTSLFPHFLESFAVAARCNLHARLLAGRDDHHQAEALFKALARALDAATRLDPRRSLIPSTKGTLRS